MRRTQRVDIADIRRENLRAIAGKLGGPAALGRKLGKSDSEVSQMIGENPTRGIGDMRARIIERKLGIAEFELDTIPLTPYTELVERVADELSIRSEEAQRTILGLIQQITPEEPHTRRPIRAMDRLAAQ